MHDPRLIRIVVELLSRRTIGINKFVQNLKFGLIPDPLQFTKQSIRILTLFFALRFVLTVHSYPHMISIKRTGWNFDLKMITPYTQRSTKSTKLDALTCRTVIRFTSFIRWHFVAGLNGRNDGWLRVMKETFICVFIKAESFVLI